MNKEVLPIFCLGIKELSAFREWLLEHDQVCRFADPANQGASGGRLTFCFTPTSLGIINKVKCACGAEKDITNFSDW